MHLHVDSLASSNYSTQLIEKLRDLELSPLLALALVIDPQIVSPINRYGGSKKFVLAMLLFINVYEEFI
jgi:hypothetical protein